MALQQAQQRAVAQVRAAVAKWNGATELVNESAGLTEELTKEVASLERLFEAGQTDLTRLMQARQRLIQLENSRLDAVWQATQAQADLLTAIGARADRRPRTDPPPRTDADADGPAHARARPARVSRGPRREGSARSLRRMSFRPAPSRRRESALVSGPAAG